MDVIAEEPKSEIEADKLTPDKKKLVSFGKSKIGITKKNHSKSKKKINMEKESKNKNIKSAKAKKNNRSRKAKKNKKEN